MPICFTFYVDDPNNTCNDAHCIDIAFAGRLESLQCTITTGALGKKRGIDNERDQRAECVPALAGKHL